MIKLVDLTYHSHLNYTRPEQVKENHAPALVFASYLKSKIDFTFVKHASFEQHVTIDDVPYYFFKGKNRFWSVSVKTHRFIKALKPDIVLIQGLVFPIQVMFLRIFCGKRFKLVIQHHGELPSTGIKGYLEKIACSLADAFLFTAAGNADMWKKRNIIKQDANIFELLEASTGFKPIEKQLSKTYTGITSGVSFLWVGHLNANKDPMTVLSGFEQHLQANPGAKLYMIYQTDELLSRIHQKLASNKLLSESVVLVGKVSNTAMPYWFSAADYYISGSHKEGSGYALLEAIACGCIPVVTDIPSYQKITGNGKYGFLYPPGDEGMLAKTLKETESIDLKEMSATVLAHFNQSLSFKTIADDLVEICHRLMAK